MSEEQDNLSPDLLKQLDHAIKEFNDVMSSLFFPNDDSGAIKANGDCKKMQGIVNLASSNTGENTSFTKEIIHV